MRKSATPVIIVLALLLVAGGTAAAVIWQRIHDPYKGFTDAERFMEVPPGTNTSAIGRMLVDAGIMDPVPVMPLKRMGCHFAIGVNAMAKLESQEVSSRYPKNAIDVMTRSMFLMAHEIGQARAEQAATPGIVFTPELGDIKMLHFSRSPEIIECGRRAAEAHLPAILAAYERLKSNAVEVQVTA